VRGTDLTNFVANWKPDRKTKRPLAEFNIPLKMPEQEPYRETAEVVRPSVAKTQTELEDRMREVFSYLSPSVIYEIARGALRELEDDSNPTSLAVLKMSWESEFVNNGPTEFIISVGKGMEDVCDAWLTHIGAWQ
jgi:hypothetical protein